MTTFLANNGCYDSSWLYSGLSREELQRALGVQSIDKSSSELSVEWSEATSARQLACCLDVGQLEFALRLHGSAAVTTACQRLRL